MRRRATLFILGLLLAVHPLAASAADFDVTGFFDFGGALATYGTPWMRGSLDKLDDGGGGAGGAAPVIQGSADVRLRLDTSFDAFATLRAAPNQHLPFDVLEAYGRYRWSADGGWQGSVKLGAFFPPISLENESVGWTSPWTLTPSAINSWVGDELRTIGGEANIEWRAGGTLIGMTGAVFGANDPTGALLADRGWAFDSRPIGLLGEPRLPDSLATAIGKRPPLREQPFKEIDGTPGWYAGASLRQDELGRIALLYYDNMADPGASSGNDFGWRTKFTSVGVETYIGEVVVLGQAMAGKTTIEPFEDFYSDTNFQAGYLLAGYYFDKFRIAGRFDLFATQQHNRPGGSGPGEHGRAFTVSGSWTPYRWYRLIAELMYIDAYDGRRLAAGLKPQRSQLQGQLVGRIYF